MSLINLQEELQSVKNEMETNRQSGLDVSSFEMRIAIINQQILTAESQQNFHERVEKDVQANGYIMDGLKSGEYTMAELAHTPEDYILQATAVQKWAIEQKEMYEDGLKQANNLVLIAQNELIVSGEENLKLSKEKNQLEIEKADFIKKLKNATDIIEELQAAQGDVAIPEVAPLTAEEQDAQWKADNAKTNNRIKVSNIRNADETGIDTRKSIVTIALTGEEVTTETIYLKGRYIEISAVETEQLRADYANKKAEIEQSIPTITPTAIPFVNEDTRQDEAATDKAPIEEELRTAAFGLAEESSNGDREVVEEENIADFAANKSHLFPNRITLESLQSQVDQIKAHIGLVA